MRSSVVSLGNSRSAVSARALNDLRTQGPAVVRPSPDPSRLLASNRGWGYSKCAEMYGQTAGK